MSIGDFYDELYPCILAVSPEASKPTVAYALKTFVDNGFDPLQLNFPSPHSVAQIMHAARTDAKVAVFMCDMEVSAKPDLTDQVRGLLDAELPGVSEALRMAQMESGYGRALFERAVAGWAGDCLVMMMPADSRVAIEVMEEIIANFKSWVLESPPDGLEYLSELTDLAAHDEPDDDHVATVLHMPTPFERKNGHSRVASQADDEPADEPHRAGRGAQGGGRLGDGDDANGDTSSRADTEPDG